jgi:hypothetical protein
VAPLRNEQADLTRSETRGKDPTVDATIAADKV